MPLALGLSGINHQQPETSTQPPALARLEDPVVHKHACFKQATSGTSEFLSGFGKASEFRKAVFLTRGRKIYRRPLPVQPPLTLRAIL